MKIQADKEATALINILIDKVLEGTKLNHKELVPLAMFQQSIKPIPEPVPEDTDKKKE